MRAKLVSGIAGSYRRHFSESLNRHQPGRSSSSTGPSRATNGRLIRFEAGLVVAIREFYLVPVKTSWAPSGTHAGLALGLQRLHRRSTLTPDFGGWHHCTFGLRAGDRPPFFRLSGTPPSPEGHALGSIWKLRARGALLERDAQRLDGSMLQALQIRSAMQQELGDGYNVYF